MTENYLQLLALLLPLLAGLLAAFWKFVDKADKDKTKFQQDIMAVRGTVISGEIIPQLIKLIEDIETERELGGRNESIENIIGRSTHGYSLQSFVKRINELNDMDVLLTKIVSYCFNCAYDFLFAAAVCGVFILWLFIDQYWTNFVIVVSFASLVIVLKLFYDTLTYTKSVHKFIQKHNELQLGRGQI